jgi:hypothetical protein
MSCVPSSACLCMQAKKGRLEVTKAELLKLDFQPADVDAALTKLGGGCDLQAAMELILSGNISADGEAQPGKIKKKIVHSATSD